MYQEPWGVGISWNVWPNLRQRAHQQGLSSASASRASGAAHQLGEYYGACSEVRIR